MTENKDMATLERRYTRLRKHNADTKRQVIERLIEWIEKGEAPVKDMVELCKTVKGEK